MDFKFAPITVWPQEFTKPRKYAQFRASYSDTLKLLNAELERVYARNVVIQLALNPRDIRLDGKPRADARPVAHPGVILSFEKFFPNGKKNEKGQPLGNYKPLSFPCDTYDDWHDNVRAIALSLEALRAIDRYGVTRRFEQYAGFAPQLEAPAGDGESFSTREAAAAFLAQFCDEFTPAVIASSPAMAERAYRAAVRKVHPDAGGDPADFRRARSAYELLIK